MQKCCRRTVVLVHRLRIIFHLMLFAMFVEDDSIDIVDVILQVTISFVTLYHIVTFYHI